MSAADEPMDYPMHIYITVEPGEREHDVDGTPCWCEPNVNITDTGAVYWHTGAVRPSVRRKNGEES